MGNNGLAGYLAKAQKGAEYFAGILLMVMVAIVFANVIARFVLNASLAWSEEVARFLFIWIVFLGSFFAYLTNEHLGLDLVVKAVSPRVATWINVVANLLVILALGIITVGGYSITVENWDWLSPATSIPYGYVNIIVPLTGAPMLVVAILRLFRNIRSAT
jgi:TRAP-type C4-dicarboxylate transport system permease small subunit